MESTDNVQISSVNQPNLDSRVTSNLGEIKQMFDKQTDQDKEMTNQEILDNVKGIIKMKKKGEMKKLKIINIAEYRRTFLQKYMRLHMNFPTIYNMVFESDTFELKRLEEMLAMRKQVEDKKITNFDASVKISQKYTDEFVKKPLNL